MSLDETHYNEKHRYTKKIQQQKSSFKSITELLQSGSCDSWKILMDVLQDIEKSDGNYFRDVMTMIDRGLERVQNFVMLVFLYWFKSKKKMSYFGAGKWRIQYRNLIQNGQMTLLSTWIQSDPNSKIAQQTLALLTQTFPYFLKQQYISLGEPEIDSIMQWVNYFHTLNAEQYENVCNIVAAVKENSRALTIKQDYVEKEHVMLKKVIEMCGKAKNCSSNIFLFLYPFTLDDKDIAYFCHSYSDFLTDLTETQLCTFFTSITKSAASPQILHIIDKISLRLKNQQSYYKLRVIYEKFILPHLARRVKACRKVQEEVFSVCQFYVVGFLRHCRIGVRGVECLVKNLGKIGNWRLQGKWVDLCAIVCTQYPELRNQAMRMLQIQLGKSVRLDEIHEIASMQSKDIIWQVTLRNGKKLKQYKKFPSQKRGIINQQNECYIISVVQALHNGNQLESLLQWCYDEGIPKYGILNQMRILFNQLSGKMEQKSIRVRYLKEKGPEQFRESFTQEDAYEYLVQLFDAIEKELKPLPKQLKKFKQLYEIKYIVEITCNKCNNHKQLQQFSYAFSLPHTQTLQKSTTETLPDFQCTKCLKPCPSVLTRTIAPSSQILIVHINRFSHFKGITKKELSTQVIRRRFLQYGLTGIICHRGKNVEHGHYVYFWRVGTKRWGLANDGVVEEFQLDAEDEEFQREWKAEMTPYILFYQQLQD